MNILAGINLAAEKYREKKYKCAALHGLFHRNKHFGMMEHATKTIHDKNVFARQVE